MEIDFCGGAYKTFSKIVNASECVNFIPIVDKAGSKVLRGTPGLLEWCDTGKYAEVRGVHNMGSYLYAVVGNAVYRVNSAGTSTACTGTLGTSSGSVSMADNGGELMIVDGTNGYIVEATTVTQITDEGFFSNPTTVTYQDGYFICTFSGSGRIQIGDLNDGTSWDATMYFNAEAKPDDSLAVLSNRRILSVFGSKTKESWYNSGATVPFDRIPGSTQEVGTGAAMSPMALANSIYYLTNNLQVVMIEGSSPKIISKKSIEYQFAQYSRTNDAIGMGIVIEGLALYILTFPTANATWAYNVPDDEWFLLMSYPSTYQNRWRGNCHCHFADKQIVGDYQNGKLYEWDFETYTDNSEIIRRSRIAPQIWKDGLNIFHHELEIFFEPGVGIVTGQGSDPQAMLRWLENGKTWSNEHWSDIGKMGKYENRVRWSRLGGSRMRNYEVTVTDPVKCVITGANLRATAGIS
jgi:hypothetical protein